MASITAAILIAALAATPGLHIFLVARPRMVVANAVEGAVRRVARADCQNVLTDFAAANGRTLASALEATGREFAAYLAALYFVDGSDEPACRRGVAVAFTAPGSHVIRICGDQFAVAFARNTAHGEILVIHEALHSLGLGENPPTTTEITDRVWMRCGGSGQSGSSRHSGNDGQ